MIPLGIIASGHITAGSIPAGYSAQVLADSPMLYYRLQEASSADPVVDASGNGRHGLWGGGVGGTSSVVSGEPSLVGEAGDFAAYVGATGSSRHIATPAFAISTGRVTHEMVLRTSDATTEQQLISRDDSTGTRRTQFRILGGKLGFIFWTTTGGPYTCESSVNAILANTTHHVAATYDGSTVQLFVGGVQVGTLAQSGTLHTDSYSRYISGRRASTTDGTFVRGWIDEPAIYDKALSPSRIAAHAAAIRAA